MEELRSLIIRAQAGDMDAYGSIVRQFQDMAVGYGYSILGDFHLAQDAAQEAFIEAYQCLPNLRELAAFPGWFRKIVLKHCDRIMRKRHLRTIPLAEAIDLPWMEKGPAEATVEQEMRDSVLGAIQALSDHQRTVTTLFYINGYSQKDIADFLETPVTTIKKRLHDSRKWLKERLSKMEGNNYDPKKCQILREARQTEYTSNDRSRAFLFTGRQ
jgi:RNA polymerase sigma factor (sigma-70 family)